MRRELRQWFPDRRKVWFAILTWTILTTLISGIWLTSDQDIAPPPYSSTVAGWLFIAAMRGVLSLQSILSEERLTGTLSWILSKPVPRSAFYLAKLNAQMIVAFVISVLIQGVFFAFTRFPAVNLGGFLLVIVYLTLIVWFYQSLTMMLDVLTTNKVAKLGIPIALILIGNFFTLLDPNPQINGITILGYLLPWGMNAPLVGNDIPNVLVTGQPLMTSAPVIATLLWIFLFCAIGIHHLNRQEL
jgi:ABC-type transport system involved in cytochrome c biogenesis permease component